MKSFILAANEVKYGEPKSLETWNKLNQLVNRELRPEKEIGMCVTASANPPRHTSPAIGVVGASVPCVLGHHHPPPFHDNELQKIFKPIRPAAIRSRQAVQKKLEINKNVNQTVAVKSKKIVMVILIPLLMMMMKKQRNKNRIWS